ncbi:MAG: disulfide bond formation protein DsbA [Sulfurimonas sp. RIFOXYD12_FULL_33_39]|nr:MAG: disulfide bond formation protein DsbA [Sulfurimonas sp. RIFCSPLOWO2_12_FULL_34_6]OHE08874.1 MAG: disulfide bond formation protein DsbA [Sulfurimonas sp. RIFOXYD12_FULL_33_39]OHE14184.1 MAG: disulfide bond formation protein DsbA [Sulfurimonas sp. RIFOXYD2_FULL_34_21]DAB28167.1 MAG TPA: disulfide bond formation protein DsbA [Sulfurimonas sp. UBA10385]
MSLMLKLLAITLTLSSLLKADSSSQQVENFLKNSFSTNPKILSIKVKVTGTTDVKGFDDWNAYFVELDAILKKDKRQVVQKMVWYSNGEVITKELFDLKSGKEMGELVSLPFKDEYYNKENLIYGNENAKHKVVIFSDPLCPFCRQFVPEAIEYMKKEPNKFAVYYYHFPLESIHPASVELVQAAIALELQGAKDVVLNLYKVNVDPKERSNEVIFAQFNKVMNSNINMTNLLSPRVLTHFKNDLKTADLLMINSTPTMFFNGIIDRTKNKYKEAK